MRRIKLISGVLITLSVLACLSCVKNEDCSNLAGKEARRLKDIGAQVVVTEYDKTKLHAVVFVPAHFYDPSIEKRSLTLERKEIFRLSVDQLDKWGSEFR